MALIRQAQAQRVVDGAVVLDLGDLANQGERLVAEARKRADAEIARAQTERDRLLAGAKEDGYRAGFAEGERAGYEAGLAEGRRAALEEHGEALTRVERAWDGALGSFVELRGHMLVSARRDVLRLAVRVAELVTRRRIELDERAVEGSLEAVVSSVLRPTRLIVRVHPDDRAVSQEALPKLLETLSSGSDAELVDDASLSRGSCVATFDEAMSGRIDASIETQLERIAKALLPDMRGDGGRRGVVQDGHRPISDKLDVSHENHGDAADNDAAGDVEGIDGEGDA